MTASPEEAFVLEYREQLWIAGLRAHLRMETSRIAVSRARLLIAQGEWRCRAARKAIASAGQRKRRSVPRPLSKGILLSFTKRAKRRLA